MSAQVGRMQWSRLGITVYASDGAFISRIEREDDRNFINRVIVEALKRISEEQVKRKELAASFAAQA